MFGKLHTQAIFSQCRMQQPTVEITLDDFKQLSTCSVCLSQVRNPWMLPCGHFFCHEPCFNKFRETLWRRCPTCRTQYQNGEEPVPFYFFRNLMARARLNANGCETDPEWIFGNEWEKSLPRPAPPKPENAPPSTVMPSATDYHDRILAERMTSDPNFVPVSQRPISERRCPKRRNCPAPSTCPYMHNIRLCMQLDCPGGEVCDKIHCDELLQPIPAEP